MGARYFRNLSALAFLLVFAFATPARAQNCGDIYNQGGCGCSGWLTINFPGASNSWCTNSDLEGCAEYACQQACPGSGGVGFVDTSCSSNQWSAWYGMKCNDTMCVE
jgi:hypothetical protein